MDFKNLYHLFLNSTHKYANEIALSSFSNNQWENLTWGQLKTQIDDLSKGLIATGFNKSNSACLICKNNAFWPIIDLAIMSIGGITVPIDPTTSLSLWQYMIHDTEAKLVFVNSQEQIDQLKSIKENIPYVTKIIATNPNITQENGIYTINDITELGSDIKYDDLEKRIEEIQPHDIASFNYTSGVMDKPKGVVITHENWLNHTISLSKESLFNNAQQTIHLLPISHYLSHGIQFVCLFSGIKQLYYENLEEVDSVLQEANPDFIVAYPHFIENLYRQIQTQLTNESNYLKKLSDWALSVGSELSQYKRNKLPPTFSLKLKAELANKLVLRKLKDKFGSQLKYILSGDTPLNPDVALFFYILNITILECYGSTKTTSITHINDHNLFKFGSIGKPISDTECKLSKNNEILIRNKSLMLSYYKNSTLTYDSFEHGGWFKSGDYGELDPDDIYMWSGCKKDLIILTSGKTIIPQHLEYQFRTSDFIKLIMVYGHKKDFLSALINLNYDMVSSWAENHNIPVRYFSEIVRNKHVIIHIQHVVDEINSGLEDHEKIRKFALLEQDLTTESGEITSTKKLRRGEIIKNHQKLFDQFYEDRFN